MSWFNVQSGDVVFYDNGLRVDSVGYVAKTVLAIGRGNDVFVDGQTINYRFTEGFGLIMVVRNGQQIPCR